MNNQSRSSAKIKNQNLIFSKLVPGVNWWGISFEFHSYLIYILISYRLSFTGDAREILNSRYGEVKSLLLISI